MRFLFAALMTVCLVGWSATIHTPGIGTGGWLLATIPLSPVIFGLMLLLGRAFGIDHGFGGGDEAAPTAQRSDAVARNEPARFLDVEAVKNRLKHRSA